MTLLLGIMLPNINDPNTRPKAVQTPVIAKLSKNASTISNMEIFSSPVIAANITENAGAIVRSSEKAIINEIAFIHKVESLLLIARYKPKAKPTNIHIIENLSKTA